MGYIIKKDLRALLPGFAMFVTGGIAMLLVGAFGIFSKNGNFTVSALYVFCILFLAAVILTAFKNADRYRRNIPDEKYFSDLSEKGVYGIRLLVYKLFQSFLMELFLVTEYVLFFYLLFFFAGKKLEDKTGMLGFIESIKDKSGIKSSAAVSVLVYLELLAFSLLIAALALLAFSLCYKFFLRLKYALAASIMTSLTMFWVVWKIYDITVPKDGAGSLVLSILYALIACFLLSVIFIWQMKDINSSGREEQ